MCWNTVCQNLKNKGYRVSVFASPAEAVAYLQTKIDGKTVGMGGSMTLQEMGLYDALATHNTVWWHQRMPEGKSVTEVCKLANVAEVYLSSVNGLAETGEIVNIDGRCNRVSAILFGHETVYLVVGRNKIAKDYENALFRARNVAAPRNAKRLGRQTPCAVKGDRCYDCNSPDRICCTLSVQWCKPMGADVEILLIDADLGY